jgi:hypothetical protein
VHHRRFSFDILSTSGLKTATLFQQSLFQILWGSQDLQAPAYGAEMVVGFGRASRQISAYYQMNRLD